MWGFVNPPHPQGGFVDTLKYRHKRISSYEIYREAMQYGLRAAMIYPRPQDAHGARGF